VCGTGGKGRASIGTLAPRETRGRRKKLARGLFCVLTSIHVSALLESVLSLLAHLDSAAAAGVDASMQT